jgi:hypothetical protein
MLINAMRLNVAAIIIVNSGLFATSARAAEVENVSMSTFLNVEGGHLVVHWSTFGFDHYNIRWSENGGPEQQVERAGDKAFQDLSAFRPGVVYRVAVQGCNKNFLGRSACTDWDQAPECGTPENPCVGSGIAPRHTAPKLPPPPVKSLGRITPPPVKSLGRITPPPVKSLGRITPPPQPPIQGPEAHSVKGQTADQYQQEFDKWTGQGFIPTDINVACVGSEVRYSAIFQKIPNAPAFVARHNMNNATFQKENATWTGQGYELKAQSSCHGVYAAIWQK